MMMVAVILSLVYLSVCLAHREDRLANRDDMEKMLRALDEKPESEIKNSVNQRLPWPKQQRNPNTTPTSTTETDVLEELHKLVEQFQQIHRHSKTDGDGINLPAELTTAMSAASGSVYTSPAASSSTTTGVSTAGTSDYRNQETSAAPEEGIVEADVMLRKILNALRVYMREGTKEQQWQSATTSHPATTTTVTTLRLPKNFDISHDEVIIKDVAELREEAISIAARASMLYLRLKKMQ